MAITTFPANEKLQQIVSERRQKLYEARYPKLRSDLEKIVENYPPEEGCKMFIGRIFDEFAEMCGIRLPASSNEANR